MARISARYGGDLVAQRLPAAGGHQHQCVATFDNVVNDGCLRAAKIGVAKNLRQDAERGGLVQ